MGCPRLPVLLCQRGDRFPASPPLIVLFVFSIKKDSGSPRILTARGARSVRDVITIVLPLILKASGSKLGLPISYYVCAALAQAVVVVVGRPRPSYR